MFTGRRGEYDWLVGGAELRLDDLVRICPQCLVGRHLVVTAFDSGPLALEPQEERAGWRRVGDLALSPRLGSQDLEKLPIEGYDEWYVFDDPPAALAVPEVFVNYGGFTLGDPAVARAAMDPTWDRRAEADAQRLERGVQDRFWAALERLRPVTFVAQGDNLVCATRDAAAFAAVLTWARSVGARARQQPSRPAT